jgi:kynurenine formamidase
MDIAKSCRLALVVASGFTLVAMLGLPAYGHARGAVPTLQGQPPPAVNDTRTTPEQFDRWMTDLSNWGRWGAEDELGAVNLITPARRRAAAALARTGVVVSLAHNLLTEKAVDAPNPFQLRPRLSLPNLYAFDREDIDFHGYTFSHLDALCHVGYKGKIYNGRSFQETVSEERGCLRMGVAGIKDRLVTRGVLIDIARLKGVPYLAPGTHVYREDIEAWEKQAGVKLQPGDAIFLRTGRWAYRNAKGPFTNLAGFDASVAPLLKERDVALIGSDGVQDVGTLPGVALPIHKFALVALGANLFDNLDLEALAETAAAQKRWTFLVTAAPNPVVNGTGSPINPLAIF